MYHICSITATNGRYKCLQRALRFFMNQNYRGSCTMLIFNNSDKPLKLDSEVEEELDFTKEIIIVNQHISTETGKPYKNLGEIYRDAFKHIPSYCDVITHSDDDDTFLQDHLSEGAKGLDYAIAQGMVAYKPKYSYLRGLSWETAKTENTMEPSIFVLKDHVEKYGYSSCSTEQHLSWYEPLVDNKQILIDPNGIPTLIYDWSGQLGVFKTSGDYHNPKNFDNYKAHSTDYGTGILTPATDEEVAKYYQLNASGSKLVYTEGEG